VETSTAGDSAVKQLHQEHGYPQFDCVGGCVWIWERLIQTEDSTEVVARQIRRDGTPR
jgi:hypothetical protein